MPTPTAIIVQADRLCAESLARAVLTAAPRARLIRATTGADTSAKLAAGRFTLAIVGIDLPDMDGLELMRRIVDARAALHVVLVVDRRDACTDYLARQLDIDGLIDVRAETERSVTAALKDILTGRKFFSAHSSRAPKSEFDIFRKLTPRELEVFAIIGCGSDDSEAAARLNIGDNTLRSHRRQIMRKLQARSLAEVVRRAIACGVVRMSGEQIVFPGLACVRAAARHAMRSDNGE